MAAYLDRVQAGQPIAIKADTWNAFVDTARDFQARKMILKKTDEAPLPPTIIKVRNDTGLDIPMFHAFYVSRPIINPSSNSTRIEFLQRVNLNSTVSSGIDEQGCIAVALEPILCRSTTSSETSPIGNAIISGVTQAYVTVRSANHRFARIVFTLDEFSLSVPTLESCEYGPVEIVWKESGIGADKLATVLLGTNHAKEKVFGASFFYSCGTPADGTFVVVDDGSTIALNASLVSGAIVGDRVFIPFPDSIGQSVWSIDDSNDGTLFLRPTYVDYQIERLVAVRNAAQDDFDFDGMNHELYVQNGSASAQGKFTRIAQQWHLCVSTMYIETEIPANTTKSFTLLPARDWFSHGAIRAVYVNPDAGSSTFSIESFGNYLNGTASGGFGGSVSFDDGATGKVAWEWPQASTTLTFPSGGNRTWRGSISLLLQIFNPDFRPVSGGIP